MKEINWYYPESVNEVNKLLQEDGTFLHGGGTGILRLGLTNIKGFVSLENLNLKYVKTNDDFVEMGSASTLSDIIEKLKDINSGSLLIKAFLKAVPNSLRNRITIGGSLANAPIWSDVVGPLVALGSEVVLNGEKDKIVPVEEYLRDKQLKKSFWIKSIRFKSEIDKWGNYYFKASRTDFDYSSFNISILLLKTSSLKVDDLRIVVSGTKNRYDRLKEAEKLIRGSTFSKLKLESLFDDLPIEFSDKKMGSRDYLKTLCKVELERGLESFFN